MSFWLEPQCVSESSCALRFGGCTHIFNLYTLDPYFHDGHRQFLLLASRRCPPWHASLVQLPPELRCVQLLGQSFHAALTPPTTISRRNLHAFSVKDSVDSSHLWNQIASVWLEMNGGPLGWRAEKPYPAEQMTLKGFSVSIEAFFLA